MVLESSSKTPTDEPDVHIKSDQMSDQTIATEFLSYLRSEGSEEVVYDVAPTPLSGGKDARIYHYKLVGKDPMVLRLLRPNRGAAELFYLQTIHSVLKQHGVKTPLIHRVCEDKSILGGVFALMDRLPGKILSEQTLETQARVIGESMAKLHELDAMPIHEELMASGLKDVDYLSPAMILNRLALFENNEPWAVELVRWFRDHLPLAAKDLSIIHGDYHANNLLYENGSLTGLLDWSFCIADSALDLACTMNVYLIYLYQFNEDAPPQFGDQFTKAILNAYQNIRPVNHERIRVYRALSLLNLLCSSQFLPERMQRPASQRDYATFIEQITGLIVSPTSLA